MSAELSFAFQPIVDLTRQTVFSYEALLRGIRGQPASTLLEGLSSVDMARLDIRAWPAALALADRLGLSSRLNLNVTPEGIAGGALPQLLLRHATVPVTHLIIEVTEDRLTGDATYFADSLNALRGAGALLAIDDFGAGYSGLNLLVDFQPDILKLDRHLVRDINAHGPRQSVVRAVLQVCEELGIDVIAEGIETIEEARWFHDAGVRFCQGFLFGRPTFEALCSPSFPLL